MTRTKNAASSATEEEVHVTGTSLDFGRDARTIASSGPDTKPNRAPPIDRGELTSRWTRPFTRESSGHRRFGRQAAGTYITTRRRHHPRQRGQVDRAVCYGRMGHSRGWDGERTWLPSAAQEESNEFHADAGVTGSVAAVRTRPKEMNLNGGVLLKSRIAESGDARILQTSALRMEFSGRKSRPIRANPQRRRHLRRGLWNGPTPQGKPAPHPRDTKLQADKLAMEFGEEGKPKQLDATGNVQTERAVAGHAATNGHRAERRRAACSRPAAGRRWICKAT